MAQAERYAFVVENFDHHSSMNWRYQFFYYLDTKEIEMVVKVPRITSCPAPGGPCNPCPHPQRDAAPCSPLPPMLDPVMLTLANLSFCSRLFFLFILAAYIKNKRTFLKRRPRIHREEYAAHLGEDSRHSAAHHSGFRGHLHQNSYRRRRRGPAP